MPKRKLAPLPSPVANVDAAGIKDPAVHEAMRTVLRQLNMTTRFVRSTVTPSKMPPPTGPFSASVSVVGGTFVVDFLPDQSGPRIQAYRIYRAAAGTRSSPTDPGPDSAACIGSMIAGQADDGGHYQYLDRNITIPQLDPANPTRFKFWVTSIDDRDIESAYVLATGSPIETQTNGPGDQSPEQKITYANKLLNPGMLADDGLLKVLDQPYAITASTNATPIVVTIGAHNFVVNDLVAIDQHLVNTNANGWWVVSAVGATTITLQGSIGNGVGGATGKAYRQAANLGGQFPPVTHRLSPVANGCTANFVQPDAAADTNYVTYTPWYADTAQQVKLGQTAEVRLQNPGGAPARSSFTSEIGLRKIPYNSRATLSLLGLTATGGDPDTTLRLEILYDDNTSIFLTDIPSSQLGVGAYIRFVWTFKFGNFTAGKKRIKVRISNLRQNSGGGGGVELFVAFPMLNIGDCAAAYSAITDNTDYRGASADVTVSWARAVNQVIVRDSSAPYA